MDLPMIDAHVHCGRQCTTDPRTRGPQPQALEDYRAWAKGSAIGGHRLPLQPAIIG
jgi:hypothetical protein